MKYDFEGKVINIPDGDIKKRQDKLKMSLNEAIYDWLCDNDYITDPEEEALTAKAKKNRVTATVHKARAEEKKERKPREKKENPLKKQIIDAIFAGLSQNLPENVDIDIKNDEKYIDLTVDGLNFTINLVQHRAKKKERE